MGLHGPSRIGCCCACECEPKILARQTVRRDLPPMDLTPYQGPKMACPGSRFRLQESNAVIYSQGTVDSEGRLAGLIGSYQSLSANLTCYIPSIYAFFAYRNGFFVSTGARRLSSVRMPATRSVASLDESVFSTSLLNLRKFQTIQMSAPQPIFSLQEQSRHSPPVSR